MKKLRVLYIIGSMGDGRAGTEKNLLTLISHLDRLAFDPILITLQDCDYFRAGKFVCDTHCWYLNRVVTAGFFAKRRRLTEFMRSEAIDVIQTFFVEAHLIGGAAARRAGINAIISSRRNLGYSYGLKEKLYLRVANRYPLRWLANSRAVAERISKIEGIARNRFEVIYNGVEMKVALPPSEHQVATVVMVANLRPVKAIPTLIDAAELVAREFPRVRFRIIGEGPDRHELQALVAALRLQGNVEMPGSTDDVHSRIASATIGVLTSTSEGFSNSLLEYMRAGLPVIATNVGGNKEIIDDGKTGYLIEIGDHRALADRILLLLQDPQMAQAMGASGRTKVEEIFSLEVMVRKHEELYRTLAAGSISS